LSLRLRSEEGTRKHGYKSTKNDEGQNGTIYSANSGISNHINYKNTTYDNSIRDIAEGAKKGSTTDGMSIGEIVQGEEIGN